MASRGWGEDGAGCEEFARERFLQQLRFAQEVAERVLGAARTPVLPSERDHSYEDKYELAETSVAAAVVSCVDALARVGLGAEALAAARAWAASGAAVTLRLRAETRCAFAREARRELPPGAALRSEEAGADGGVTKTTTTSVVQSVTEFFWDFDADWRLELLKGAGRDAGDVLRLSGRAASLELKTAVKAAPHAAASAHPPRDVSLSWLLAQLRDGEDGDAAQLTSCFAINRARDGCATPRRNADVDAALRWVAGMARWAEEVGAFFRTQLLPVEAASQPELRVELPDARGILVPCVLFCPPPPPDAPPPPPDAAAAAAGALAALPAASRSPLLSRRDVNALLAEAAAALASRCGSLAPEARGLALLSDAEAALLVATDYLGRVAAHARDAVDYIESLLRDQLIAAVGKVVSPADFGEYLRFHNRRLFKPAFQPRPFCFAVRRSAEHGPEGLLRIDEGGSEPISTMSSASDAGGALMTFPLSAEATVSFAGERVLHAWLAHRFSAGTSGGGGGAQSLTLLASARQFSSFVVLVGRIASPTSFEPVLAAIVKDKDELRIPLQLAALPTPQEFRDAIASLSPEQQRFARAFRAAQLQSTLFGVLVLQIKPQLELLLGLQPDLLTKEIELTQDLMELFVTYQIPSDLLSFAGAPDADGATRLTAVKGHAAAIRAMLTRSEDRALAQLLREEAHANPGALFGSAAPPPTATPFQGGGFGGAGLFGAAPPAAAGPFAGAMPQAFGAMPQAFGSSGAMAMNAPAARRHRAAPMMAAAVQPFGAAPATFADAQPPSAPPPPLSAPDAATHAPSPAAQPLPTSDAAAAEGEEVGDAPPGGRDVTKLPGELDKAYETYDTEGALRPTVITPHGPWQKTAQASLLSRAPVHSTLHAGEQDAAKRAAFDLLDALSRSGALPLQHASLHVLLGATHCFDETLMDTVVRGNVNPIERVERSQLIMAAAVHQLPPQELLRREQALRVAAHSPALLAGVLPAEA